MVKLWVILLILVAFLISGCSSASVSPVAKIVGRVVTNVASALFKWLWSLKSTTKTETSSHSMMKFVSGYTVETVFDGSKLGIDPYCVEVSESASGNKPLLLLFLLLAYQLWQQHQYDVCLAYYKLLPPIKMVIV